MKRSPSLPRYVLLTLLGLAWLITLGIAGAYVYVEPGLPTSEAIKRVELQVPLRVYTRSGELIAQFGEKRLIPVTFDDIPPLVRQAVLAAEDDRFFEHPGMDWTGVARAVWSNLTSANLAGQGGSTITQQAARNMFLTLDKTLRRKVSEVFVTFQMERDLTKEEILATYLNVIFFGQRSYGVAAAAETFYGKRLADLTIGEAATLAGIIQLPSRYNPVTSPQNAEMRRSYVLRRMQELGYIDAAQAELARKEPVASRGFAPLHDVEAPWVAELARQEVVRRFGEDAVNSGYRVYTTLDGRLQSAANRAVRLGLMEYDRRHGYRGPLAQVTLPAAREPAKLDALIGSRNAVGLLQVAVVTQVEQTAARIYIRGEGDSRIEWDGMSWARPIRNGRMGPAPKRAADVLAEGDVIHVISDRRGTALLAQVPDAQGALVALDPEDGAVVSMVGGFDFYARSGQFNRATQARRQPGSGFKPFLYSAALEHGLTPASIILDAPIVVDSADVEGGWRPENSSRDFIGPMRLREALVRSRNLVSIRLLRTIGIDPAIEHATLFGFEREALPRNETLALGTLVASPLQVASAYAVFANGGYRIEPYFIERIESASGEVLYQAAPKVVCRACEPPPRLPGLDPFAPPAPTPAEGGEDPAASLPPGVDATSPVPMPLLTTPSEYEAATRWQALVDRRVSDAPQGLAGLAAEQGGRGFLHPDRIAPRVISEANAWLMSDIMRDVIRRGTAQRARVLNREDIGGKTGTSNNDRDAWFNGFNQHLVATAWLGFDDERSLNEESSSTAVPVWVHFMREALRATPDEPRPMPPGVLRVRVDPRTGARADPLDPDAISEAFMVQHQPPEAMPGSSVSPGPGLGGTSDPLF